jgi:hypothetical protein
MSIQTAIFQTLAADTTLGGLLALSTIDGTQPALYERWAPENTPMPYINLSYSTIEGDHWAKREATLVVDIFSDQDSINAEAIKNRVIKILNRQIIELENENNARVHYNNDSQIDEPTPAVHHWSIEFSIIYWRKTGVDS